MPHIVQKYHSFARKHKPIEIRHSFIYIYLFVYKFKIYTLIIMDEHITTLKAIHEKMESI